MSPNKFIIIFYKIEIFDVLELIGGEQIKFQSFYSKEN